MHRSLCYAAEIINPHSFNLKSGKYSFQYVYNWCFKESLYNIIMYIALLKKKVPYSILSLFNNDKIQFNNF